MKSKFLFVVFLLVSSLSSFSQKDVEVDLVTGRAVISIPIWKFRSGALTSVVSAYYSGGGIKVSEGEGALGVGWNLDAGGQITREVMGLPDHFDVSGDARKGWLANSARVAISNFNPTQDVGCNDWNNFNQLITMNDTEPDIYHFQAPGLNGKFIYDNSGNIKLLPYQDLKINYLGTPSYFEITTNEGIKYTFSAISTTTRLAWDLSGKPDFEYGSRYFQTPVSYTNAWHLTSITAPSGEVISFTYSTQITTNRDLKRKFNTQLTGFIDLYRLKDEVTIYRLSTIVANDYSAAFNWVDTHLAGIDITSQSNLRTINFGYKVVEKYDSVLINSDWNTIPNGSRNYLTKITEESNCNSYPSYQFEYYYPNLLPYDTQYPVDYFGYPNALGGFTGVPNEATYLKPAIYKSDASTTERFRIYPATGYTAVSSGTMRNVLPAVTHFGSLKKVIYPSGGYSQISYEPNTYYDATAGIDAYGAGVRVKSIKFSDGDADLTNDIIQNYEYKLANGYSSGRWKYAPSFAFADGVGVSISPTNLVSDGQIIYDRVSQLSPGNGKTVSEYLNPGSFPQTAVSDWKATKTRIISFPDANCANVGNLLSGYYQYPYAPNTNYDFEQGLSSKILHYNEAGTLLKEQSFTYQRIRKDTAVVKGFRWGRTYDSSTYTYSHYSYIANVDKPLKTEKVTTFDTETPTVSLVSTSNFVYNNYQLLSEITTTNSDTNVSKTKWKYANDYVLTTPSGLQAQMLKKLCDINRHGTVVETINSVNNVVTNANLNLFDDWGTNKVSLKQSKQYVGNGTFQESNVVGSQQVFAHDTAYFLSETIEEYNAIGSPITSVARNKSLTSVIYGPDMITPVTTVSSARAKEIVFSDFENTEGYQIAVGNTTDAWSGQKAYQLAANIPLSKTSVIKSVASNYRFRCRAKAITGSIITLTVNASKTAGGWNSLNLTYPVSQSGNWFFMEGIVPMTGVASTFTFQVVANSSLLILDDICFYPLEAELQSVTSSAFLGKTSQTDNRGVSTFFEYDAVGRIAYIKNTNKELVQQHEYRYQVEPAPAVKSYFTSTVCCNILEGTTLTFTATTNCMNSLTYQWSINGIVQSATGLTMTYTFLTSREYEVKLLVTHPTYGSSSTVLKYDVEPIPLALTVAGDQTPINCTVSTIRSLNLSVSGCYDTSKPIKCIWYFRKDNGAWIAVQSTTGVSNLSNFNCYGYGAPASSVSFKCEITDTRCSSGVYYSNPTSGVSSPFTITVNTNVTCPN